MNLRSRRLMITLAPQLASLALFGCAGMAPMGTPITPKFNPTPCTQGTCEIKVVIHSCANPGGIDVDPSYVSNDKRNTVMHWKIVTPGYEFEQTNGIGIYSSAGEFQPLPSNDPTEFRLLNKNSRNGTHEYAYSVQVKVSGGGVNCTVYDPWIRNVF